jgi:multicomponent Na+:H+ antiporter subunit C
MEILLAILLGGLYAAGFYLMMRRSIVKLILGLVMLGHATNLLILTVSRVTRGEPAFIGPSELLLTGTYGDPLPQALILTAIVIGFGLQAFALVLVKRAYQAVGTDDIDAIRSTELLMAYKKKKNPKK